MALISEWLLFSSATIMAILGAWLGSACWVTIFEERRKGVEGRWPHGMLAAAGLFGLVVLTLGMWMIVTWTPTYI